MIKLLLNAILSLILGKLKPILLKHIAEVDVLMMSNEDKRNTVINNFTADLVLAGKDIGKSVMNLVVEAGVNIFKGKSK